MENFKSGGGYISPLSREKASLIKTPLKYHTEWNDRVNKAQTMQDIDKLKYELKESNNETNNK